MKALFKRKLLHFDLNRPKINLTILERSIKMKKIWLILGSIILIAGGIYYALLIRVEQQVQDNYITELRKQAKHPKVITVKDSMSVGHIAIFGHHSSGKVTFMNRLIGYSKTSTPIVLIFTDTKHPSKKPLMLAKNWQYYDTLTLRLPPSTYLVDVYSPFNKNNSFYNTAKSEIVKIEDNRNSLHTLSYKRFKNPDYDTIHDEFEYLKQNQNNLAPESISYQKLKKSYLSWLNNYHKLPYSDRVKLAKIL